jgi:alanyl-tRNA synthetase
MLKVKDLRDSFIKYFEEKQHKIVHSSPLIPQDDPTLLFTTAGMVQFKPMFAGTVKLDYTRAATVQKCLRTSDLENVGKTKRHCTFFEMLGNFSFGDYFKREAIEFAWDYSVNVLKFDETKLWVSVYKDDDEAYDIWHKEIGVVKERIVRLGKKDNFWGPAGDSGACGPCSELYVDKGEAAGCGSKDCKPGCDCDRFMEYWNLVFNQFNQDVNGKQTPLPQTGIDTGMGLERLATICQDVTSIYDTDELRTLVNFVCDELNIKYEGENVTAANVLVEHARALTFAMADGAYPSNEGRGYVLRRVLRRALRFGRQVGVKEAFVYKLVDPIVEIMGDYYPEIVKSAQNIKKVLEGEEKRFLETLENGMQRLEEIMKSVADTGKKKISGHDAFLLYDTYGFPVEMTQEIAEERSLFVDMKSFEEEMQAQRDRGKQSWKANDSDFENAMIALSKIAGATKFTGYTEAEQASHIIVMSDGKGEVSVLNEGDAGYVVTEATSFYAESGGQIGDTGYIRTANGAVFRVTSTKKTNNTFIHHGKVGKGSLATGDKVETEIDVVKRNMTKANHTATHLLQAALQEILGSHVKQAGSNVDAERFRFDFSHFEAMTVEQIKEVEDLVNEKILENIEVTAEEMNFDKALEQGAMAEFGEKYGDVVRVISAGDFSKELCGGTHVDNSGKIGVFKILKESSPGAGVRRIEGVTLKGVLDRYNIQNEIVNNIAAALNVPEKELVSKIGDLVKKNSELQKQLDKFKSDSMASGVDDIIDSAVEVSGVKVVVHQFDGAEVNEMRSLSDLIRSKEKNSLVIFGSDVNSKAMLLCAATKPAVEQGVDCGSIIKQISPVVGGGGGGRKDMAQAGGKNPAQLKDALEKGLEHAKQLIS